MPLPEQMFVPLFSRNELLAMLERAEMAAEVTMPVERFRDLVLQALQAVPEGK